MTFTVEQYQEFLKDYFNLASKSARAVNLPSRHFYEALYNTTNIVYAGVVTVNGAFLKKYKSNAYKFMIFELFNEIVYVIDIDDVIEHQLFYNSDPTHVIFNAVYLAKTFADGGKQIIAGAAFSYIEETFGLKVAYSGSLTKSLIVNTDVSADTILNDATKDADLQYNLNKTIWVNVINPQVIFAFIIRGSSGLAWGTDIPLISGKLVKNISGFGSLNERIDLHVSEHTTLLEVWNRTNTGLTSIKAYTDLPTYTFPSPVSPGAPAVIISHVHGASITIGIGTGSYYGYLVYVDAWTSFAAYVSTSGLLVIPTLNTHSGLAKLYLYDSGLQPVIGGINISTYDDYRRIVSGNVQHELPPVVLPGWTYTYNQYGVEVSYVTVIGDTPASVAAGLAAVINSLSGGQWDVYDRAPHFGEFGGKPFATAVLGNISVDHPDPNHDEPGFFTSHL